jgi:hypothetical protein
MLHQLQGFVTLERTGKKRSWPSLKYKFIIPLKILRKDTQNLSVSFCPRLEPCASQIDLDILLIEPTESHEVLKYNIVYFGNLHTSSKLVVHCKLFVCFMCNSCLFPENALIPKEFGGPFQPHISS